MISPSLRAAVEQHTLGKIAPLHHVLAFLEVETGGVAFETVRGERRALIRWEGHYFHRRLRTQPEALAEAESRGLADSRAGGVQNPRDQGARYDLLETAAELLASRKLDRDLAYECISIGLGQVMGSHWDTLGYASAQEMLRLANESIDAQFDMMLRYFQEFDLLVPLQNGEWAILARGWNGPGYRKNRYDEKLRDAALRYKDPDAIQWPTIRHGAHGPAVKDLQEKLKALHYPLGAADGIYGAATRAQVLAFQADHGLTTDGIAGPATWAALEVAAPRPIAVQRQDATVSDLRKAGSRTVKEADITQAAGVGTVIAGAGGLVTSAVEGLANAQDAIAPVRGTLEVVFGDWVPWLTLAVGAVIVWRMWKAKQARVEDHRTGRNMGR